MQTCDGGQYRKLNQEKRASSKRLASTTGDDLQQPPVKKFFISASTSHSVVDPVALTNAVSNYIIQSMRPIAEVENEGFINLMSTAAPEYRMPSRKTMRTKVVASCTAVTEKLKAKLQDAKFCAAQIDIWSSRRMHRYSGM